MIPTVCERQCLDLVMLLNGLLRLPDLSGCAEWAVPSVICCCGMRFGDGARFEFPLQLSSPWRELGPPLVLYGVMKREREREGEFYGTYAICASMQSLQEKLPMQDFGCQTVFRLGGMASNSDMRLMKLCQLQCVRNNRIFATIAQNWYC